MRSEIDKSVRAILEEQRARAAKILKENQTLVTSLRDLLLEKKVLDREALAGILPLTEKKNPSPADT